MKKSETPVRISAAGSAALSQRHGKTLGQRILENWQLYALLLIPVVLTIVYKYIPMYGIQIAFRDFDPNLGYLGSRWVGFDWFTRFFKAPTFWRMMKNTVAISVFGLLWSFPVPIILSLVINQVRFHKFKRVVQTVLYAPHFISVMVICGMIKIFLSPTGGLLNLILGTQIDFLTHSEFFRTIYIVSGIWQDAGWGCIIYLATLANVDPGLYEAAKMDGASVFQRILHIDIPELMPMVVLNLIMAAGGIMNVGFEKVWLLQTDLNKATSDVIAVYVYQQGIEQAKYSYSTDFYPVDCVFTQSELDDLDLYKPDFENHVKEQEALWFRDGGPSDEEWAAYKQDLIDTYGMEQILEIYKNAYERYAAAE